MTDYQVERILGCTPCVCGDLAGWHQECYRGKTQEQIDTEHKRAFAKARRVIKRDALNAAVSSLAVAAHEEPSV